MGCWITEWSGSDGVGLTTAAALGDILDQNDADGSLMVRYGISTATVPITPALLNVVV